MSIALPFPDVAGCLSANLPNYFNRHRKGQTLLGPSRVLNLLVQMCALGQSGYRRTLTNLTPSFIQKMGWKPVKRPTASAFCQARYKVTEEHCRQGFEAVFNECRAARRKPEFRFGDFDVYALDGSGLSLPISDELLAEFGCPSNNLGETGVPAAHLVALWNIGTQQPIDFDLSPYKHCERKQGINLLHNLNHNSLLLTDMGFYSYEFVGELRKREINYLLRVRPDANPAIQDFVNSGAIDRIIEISPPSSLNKKEREQSPAFKIRIIKVPLRNGDFALYVTNLKKSQGYSYSRLRKLYTTRWRIESAFDELKNWHSLQHFSAKHKLGIIQEIWAAFIYQLLVAELETKARKEIKLETKNAKESGEPLPTIRFNRRIISDAVQSLMQMAIDAPEDLPLHLKCILREIYRYRTKRKPGRTFERKRKSPAKGYKKSTRKKKEPEKEES